MTLVDVPVTFVDERRGWAVSLATVFLAEDRMVLDLVDPDGARYTVAGRLEGSRFVITEQAGPPGDSAIHAEWTRVDDRFIGRWVEAGMVFYFHFGLESQAPDVALIPGWVGNTVIARGHQAQNGNP